MLSPHNANVYKKWFFSLALWLLGTFSMLFVGICFLNPSPLPNLPLIGILLGAAYCVAVVSILFVFKKAMAKEKADAQQIILRLETQLSNSNAQKQSMEADLMARMTVMVDVGEQLEAQKRKLDRQAKTLHHALDDCFFPILITNQDGVIIFANTSATVLWLYDNSNLLNRNILSLFVESAAKDFQNFLLRLEYEQKRQEIEFEIVRKDSTRSWVHVSMSNNSLRSDSEEYTFFIDDIALQRAATLEVQKLSLVAEYISESVIITDKDGLSIWTNPSTKKLTGYAPEELLGKKPGDCLQGPLTAPEHIEAVRAGIDLQIAFNQEILNYHKDGHTYWIDLSITPIFKENGELDYYIGVQRDISVHKTNQILIEESNRSLAQNNARLEQEIDRRVKDIRNQSEQIRASIQYAKRIQDAILPSTASISSKIPDSFVFFAPRDIVSGDFYWFADKYDKSILVTADCTGHGVPGAFISLICESLLNKIVHDYEIQRPARILLKMNEGLKEVLRRDSQSNMRDGMEAAICYIDHKRNKIIFCGAKSDLFYVQNGAPNFIKGTKNSIDGGENYTFKDHNLEVGDGLMAYMASDGFQDQFGGATDSKFLRKKFHEFLFSISHLELAEQKQKLEAAFKEWKGSKPQTDDVLVLGVRFTPQIN